MHHNFVFLKIDDDIAECGPAEVASWAAQAIDDCAVGDGFNPSRAGITATPETREQKLAEHDAECSVKTSWLQHRAAEDVENEERFGDAEGETVATYLVIPLKKAPGHYGLHFVNSTMPGMMLVPEDRFYLKELTRWEA